MNSQQLIVYVLIIGYILYKQVQPKLVRTDTKGKYLLCLLGLYRFIQAIQEGKFQFNMITITGLIFTLLVLSGGFAYLRSKTYRIRTKQGKIYKQATCSSILLWFIMIFLHGMVDHLISSLSNILILYLGISVVVQHWVLLIRVNEK